MPYTDFPRRRRLPLAVRISFLLILAAVLPLLITVAVSEYNARPALISQANDALQTDAQTRAQLINTYLSERKLDAETLSQVASVQDFLQVPPTNPPSQAFLAAAPHAVYALGAGKYRDNNYLSWWLFYPNGTPSLSYPQGDQPRLYGKYVVPPEILSTLKKGKTNEAVLSPVYYDNAAQMAFIDIYAPIYKDGKPNEPFLGFMRASLSMKPIWDILRNDRGFNQSGSAFILDQNGVRIADTNPKSPELFTSVSPLSQDLKNEMADENWYGQVTPASEQIQPALQHIAPTFTFTPSGANEDYQAASNKLTVPNWTYVAISPSKAITKVADDQLFVTIIVALIVAALAGASGLWVSGLITRPIKRAVDQLRENSTALNSLAKKQQSASTEQLWVVDSIQVGQQSLQYYTDATRIAAHKLGEVGTELEANWRRQNIETIKQGLQHVITAANYIEKATHYQGDSNQKLATAIKVTTQVNEQLADGAISATEAASQLEMVVNDLRSVIGQ